MDGMSFISRSLSLVCMVFCRLGVVASLSSGVGLVLVTMFVTSFFLLGQHHHMAICSQVGGLLGTVKAWSCPFCVWADQR